MSIYSQISGNKFRSYLIIFLFIAIFTGFFYILGKFTSSPGTYLTLGIVVSLASAIGSYFYSDKLVLLTTGAQPADKKIYFDFYTVAENLAMGSSWRSPYVGVFNRVIT